MRTQSLRSLATLAFAAAVLLTGCTAGSPSAAEPPAGPSAGSTDGGGGAGSSDMLDQMIADGLANAKSDFQREVLTQAQETGTISEADWKEAHSQEKKCLADQGYTVEMIYEGTKVLTQSEIDENESSADAEKRKQASMECYEKTSSFINEIYSYLNGDGEAGMDGDTVQRAVLACLIERELVPAELAYDEFVADLEQNDGKQYAPNGQPNEEEIAQCWIENT